MDLDDENFDRDLMEIRNMPAHRRPFAPEWQAAADECDRKQLTQNEQAVYRYNKSSRHLSPLRLGMSVRIQDVVSSRWNKVRTIVGIGRHRDYHVKLQSGRVRWRNRRFLQPHHGLTSTPDATSEKPPTLPQDKRQVRFTLPSGSSPQKNTRQRTSPQSLGISTE